MSARAAASPSGRAHWSAPAEPRRAADDAGQDRASGEAGPVGEADPMEPPREAGASAQPDKMSGSPGPSTSAEQGATAPAPEEPAPTEATPQAHHHLHPHLSDRWRWRRKIRANPRQLFIYRIVIGVLGLLCICAGAVTGPLPGPGGIPLVLLGLAIWASEFRWAHRLMEWFKLKLHQVRRLPPRRKALFWVCFVAACLGLGYLGLLIVGIPDWLPASVHGVLSRLPGVR